MIAAGTVCDVVFVRSTDEDYLHILNGPATTWLFDVPVHES